MGLSGGMPTMATCRDQPGLPFAWSNDDIAYQNFLFAEPYAFDATDILANRGFEPTSADTGTAFWTDSSGTVTYKSSGGRSGPGNVAWVPSNSSGYLYQRVDLATGDLVPPSGATDLYVSASAYGRLVDPPNGSAYKSAISLSVYTRSVDYEDDPTSCDYPLGLDDQDWNSQSLGTPVQRATTNGVVGALTYSAWNEVALSPTLLLQSDIDDGTRLELRVAGYAINSTSEVRPILLDDVRMMVGGCQCA